MKFSYAREGLQIRGIPRHIGLGKNPTVQLVIPPDRSEHLMKFLKSIFEKPAVNFCFHCGSQLPHLKDHPEYCTICHNGKKSDEPRYFRHHNGKRLSAKGEA